MTPNDSFQGSARFHVAQAGVRLTITGSVTLLGTTAQLTVTGTINEMGLFIPTSGGVGDLVNDSCGEITRTSANITFSWHTLRWEEAASTQFCGNFEVSGTLSR